jgi:phage antirepressor YoqD-like protein
VFREDVLWLFSEHSFYTIMNNIILSKESSNEELKTYFNAVLELSQSNNEFPVNLDDVWMLVYGRKQEAVRALTSNDQFIEGVDYQSVRKDAQQDLENSWGGNNKVDYKLSISCLEFFIARKVRPVFEVYRQVFHKAINNLVLPKTFAEALRLAAEQAEQLEKQQARIEEMKPKEEFFDQVTDSKDACDMATVAKVLNMGIGRNKLFEILRDNKILQGNNQPMQRYVDSCWFRVIETQFTKPNGDICINFKTIVYQKGIEGIRKLLASLGYKKAGN